MAFSSELCFDSRVLVSCYSSPSNDLQIDLGKVLQDICVIVWESNGLPEPKTAHIAKGNGHLDILSRADYEILAEMQGNFIKGREGNETHRVHRNVEYVGSHPGPIR